MDFGLSAFALARMQFAFTVSFHIIFPATSIGLACFLAVLEWKWLRSRNPLYQDLFKPWHLPWASCLALSWHISLVPTGVNFPELQVV